MNALFLALLLTIAADKNVCSPCGAQTFLSAPNLSDLALLPVRDGFVMAWSDGPRIYTEHLDANLQATNAPFSFPLVMPTSVTSLALASNGTSVLVTWEESRWSNVPAQYTAILDVDGRSLLSGPLFMAPAAQPAAAGVKDGRYVVTGGQRWTLDDHLGVVSIETLTDSVATAVSAAGETASAAKKISFSCTSVGGFNPSLIVRTCTFDETVTFTGPAGKSAFGFQWITRTVGFQPVLPPVDPLLWAPLLGVNGDGFVGATVTSGGSSVCEVRDRGRTWTTPRNLLAIAGNGDRVLAVWRDSLGLRAMFLDGETFTVSDDGDIPKIVPAGSNAFVVIFRRGPSLVARKISVEAPRGRAVR